MPCLSDGSAGSPVAGDPSGISRRKVTGWLYFLQPVYRYKRYTGEPLNKVFGVSKVEDLAERISKTPDATRNEESICSYACFIRVLLGKHQRCGVFIVICMDGGGVCTGKIPFVSVFEPDAKLCNVPQTFIRSICYRIEGNLV